MISNCCHTPDRTVDIDGTTFSAIGRCPDCGRVCRIIDEDFCTYCGVPGHTNGICFEPERGRESQPL